jgi:predicted nuclease of predicted toxin-antitoxin system
VRFLIDECLAQRVGELLAASGHDAVHVSDIGLLGAVDELVMAAAEADSRVVVSADTDFGGLLAKSGAKQPSVILFRREDRHAESQAALVEAAVAALLTDEIESGFIAVIGADRMRVRTLPLGPTS